MKIRLLISLFFASVWHLDAQVNDSTNTDYLRVYLDGAYNYQEYIKTEIPFVSYVRDRFEADLHLLIAGQITGSGGFDYTLFFLGQGKFAGKNDTLHYIANTNNTEDESRTGLVQIIKMGLLPYIAKLPGNLPISITYSGSEGEETKQEDDKWNSWVFSISSYVNANISSIFTSYNISGNLSANKVTDDWKIGIDAGANYNTDIFVLDDSTNYESFNNSTYSDITVVKSLNDHWSIGGEADYYTSTFSNYDANINISPAIEYNIFPYGESTTKLLTFFYKIGPEYSNYTDTTIFEKESEILLRNRLDVSLSMTQKWGSIAIGINGSNYFHDLSKNSAGCFTSLNWRITEGLTINGFFTVDFQQDQLNLPKGDLSEEEILLQISEQKSSFNFYTFFGISYTFGSIYNNVVNPRFEGGNYSFYF
mgnify:CR=1 FL=1